MCQIALRSFFGTTLASVGNPNESDDMLENELQKSFNLSQFRPGQREIISAALAKKDVLAVMPTGSGKSLCFQFPAVQQQGLVIVISPLIALMNDQVVSLQKKGLRAGGLFFGQSQDEKRNVFRQINDGGSFVLYLSPERVQKEGFQTWIKDRPIVLFAVDEAHCVSQWGHDFREEYAGLKILKTLRPDVPVLALTASATPTVLDDIAKNLCLKKPERLVHGFYRSNLYYQVQACADDEEKTSWLLQSVKQNRNGRILIYCGTRKITEQVAGLLSETQSQVGFYHAGLSTDERTRVQSDYQQGKIRILVATNAFGMGIDQPDVRLVVHFQIPANIDSLYQEMGRAGRDGNPSTCLMLYSKKDKGLQSYFLQNSTASQEIKNLRWRNLDALIAYAEGGECRHAEILTYYKDSQRLKRCGHCDSCDPASSMKIQTPMVAPVIAKVKLKVKQAKEAVSGHVTLDPEQQSRFQSLKVWRKAKADELDLPAFVIFGDKTLRELAVRNPQSLDELKGIYGIGEAKIEKFGWDLIAQLGS